MQSGVLQVDLGENVQLHLGHCRSMAIEVSQVGATAESVILYDCYAAGDSERGQILAVVEGVVPNAGHALGDDGVLASQHQLVGGRDDDGVAVFPGIIDSVLGVYDNLFEAVATVEGIVADAGYAGGNT